MLQRQVIPIRFNQGIDVGGEDPRVKVGGLLKAENLLVDRGGVLVARGGLTSVGKAARAVAASNSVIVFTDARSDTRLITNGSFSNSRITNESAYTKTVWEKVAVGPEVNADINSWVQITPLVFSNYAQGTNLYAHLSVSNGATRTAVVNVMDADRSSLVTTKTLLANTNNLGMVYDSEDGKLYFFHMNTGTTEVRFSTCNLLAASPSFTANANVAGLAVNCVSGYNMGSGIVRYEKKQTTDPGVYIKRLILSYFHTNAGGNHFARAVSINTAAMTLGADTNETAEWSTEVNDAAGLSDVRDFGMRSADTTWRIQANTATNLRVVQYSSDNAIYPLVMTTSGLSFISPIVISTGFVSVKLGDSKVLDAAAFTGSNQSAVTMNGIVRMAQVEDESADNRFNYLFASCRPFTMNSGATLVDIYPLTFHGGLWTSAAPVPLKASSQSQHIIYADGIPQTDNSSTRAYITSRLSVGTAYSGNTRINTFASTYTQHDVQKFGGYSYGNSSYTNAYFLPLLEQAGSRKRVVLFRATAEDGFFSEFTAARHRDSVVVSGGYPTIAGRGSTVSIAFPTYPEGLAVSIVNNGSTNSYSSLGNVAFCAAYEKVTPEGLIYRSAPSPTVSIALTNVKNIISTNVYSPPREIGVLDDTVAVIYRTEPNGTQLFECARQTFGNASTLAFTIRAETLVQSDAYGTSPYLRSLYTQTEAENIYPFQHKAGCTHADRYFYAVGDGDIYYSKPNAGGVGIEFNEFFNLKVPASGGEIIALASMDDKLVIFKRNEIYTTYGDGFGPNLGGSNLAPPRRIANGVGASNRLCVTVIPQGVLFLSDSGIWLLRRDEQVIRIGSNVSYYTSNYTYTCAATNSKKRYAIFVSKDSDAPALVFSFDTDIWTTFTGLYAGQKFVSCDDNGNDIVGGGINTAATSSTNAGDAYLPIYMTNANSTETFNAVVETGWYSFSGLLGFQRWKSTSLFMENKNGHTLTVNTAYDADPYWTDNQQFDSNALVRYDYTQHFGAMTNSALADQTYKIEFGGSRQKTDALRHQFKATNITGGSVSFLGMAFDVAQKPGPVRLGANKKIG